MTPRPALVGCAQPPIPWEPGAFPLEKRGLGMKLTTHLQIVLRLTMVESYLQSLICFRRVVLNYIIKYRGRFAFKLKNAKEKKSPIL
jgi:hypothetical protein